MIIRKEELKDKEEIYNLVKEAFKNAEHSDGQEHNLVNKLRNSESFIPELALVAEDNEKIAAHIMYTKVHIVNGEEKYESLALAPLSFKLLALLIFQHFCYNLDLVADVNLEILFNKSIEALEACSICSSADISAGLSPDCSP